MADYKQYISQIQENGNVMIYEDVVANIVAHAMAEVEGIGSLGSKPGVTINDFATKKTWSKGLKVMIAEDNTVSIDCTLMVSFGYSVVDVAAAVQQSVIANVESMTGVKVTDINVNVCGIVHK
jgi:uncharacterized alkaline shock family protein YloU